MGETRDGDVREQGGALAAGPTPGIVVILAAGRACLRALQIPDDGLEIGREKPPGLLADDEHVSRRHVRIALRAGALQLTELGSKNGCFVDARKLEGQSLLSGHAIVRIGHSLLWAVPEIAPFLEPLEIAALAPDVIAGAKLRRTLGAIAHETPSANALIRGEAGSGHELAARVFHAAHFSDAAHAPFVSVDCAALPVQSAERLLFGSEDSALGFWSGACHGTLFLDAVDALALPVQDRLTSALATPGAVPRICAATRLVLRDEVQGRRFREALYFRLAQTELVLPPLRERVDEIAFHIARALAGVRLRASVAFIEACALRPWPGNVSELCRELEAAAQRVLAARVHTLEPEHLAREAGFATTPGPRRTQSTPPLVLDRQRQLDASIERALAEQKGNVRGTARALGIPRHRLRRWIEKRKQSAGRNRE